MQAEDAIDLRRLYLIIRRQLLLIMCITFSFIGAAVGYLNYTKPLYTAQTRLLLDKSFTSAISDISSKRMSFDAAAIESEVEVIKSRGVAESVINTLLDRNLFPDLINNPDKMDQAVQQILSDLQVKRVGETYVLLIQYTSPIPEISSLVSNSFAEAYISDQLNAMAQTSTTTLNWLRDKKNQIKEELLDAQKKVSKYRLNYNNMKLRERNEQQQNDVAAKFTLAELISLEKNVSSLEALYDSYLEKLDTLSLQQSFPVTETRIITKATPPSKPSHPKNIIILGAAFILGLGISLLIALIRDNFDKTLRRAGQVNKEIAVSFLGFFPKSRKREKLSIDFKTASGEDCQVMIYGQSITNDFSLCAETIRSIKNAIESTEDTLEGKVIGVISAFAHEQSSIIANNLALYTARAGFNTLYIDANIRRPMQIKTKAKGLPGLSSILLKNKDVDEVALVNKDLNLSFIPSFAYEAESILPHADQKIVNAKLSRYRHAYSYTIIDLPPLIAGADAFSFASNVDYFVVVSEWGKILPNSLNFYIQQNKIDKKKIIGLVLNKANMSALQKFYGHTVYSK